MTGREPPRGRRDLSVGEYVQGIRDGDRAILARAITLIESQHRDSSLLAQEVLVELLPSTGRAHRVGITGVPGVGKSTFIDSLGVHLVEKGLRVAVLAVDPTSSISGGSILGDKSRMPRLATDPRAFVRPSPSALSPGGVGRRTRETMLLCEAAGFDVVIVETVGVGQSETLVAEMVDCFLLLLLPGAGDELQGIKKGILELADLLAVNKADGDNLERALTAQRDYQAAMRYLRPRSSSWAPPVLAVSGQTGNGLDELWQEVERHRLVLTDSGEFQERRRLQSRRWMWSLIEERLMKAFRENARVRARLSQVEQAVLTGETTPTQGAEDLLKLFEGQLEEPLGDSD